MLSAGVISLGWKRNYFFFSLFCFFQTFGLGKQRIYFHASSSLYFIIPYPATPLGEVSRRLP